MRSKWGVWERNGPQPFRCLLDWERKREWNTPGREESDQFKLKCTIFFLTPSLTLTTATSFFFAFFLSSFLLQSFSIPGEFRELRSNISLTLDENLWRKNIPKLTTFGTFFQLPHSALHYICKKKVGPVKHISIICTYLFTVYFLICMHNICAW